MEYFEEVLDRKTGDLETVSLGEWITITELGDLHQTGRRDTRTILRRMRVLEVEGAATHQRHRLSAWVVNRGWGKRLERKGKVPFDVVGPELQQWVAQRWSSTVDDLVSETTSQSLVARAALERFNSTRLHHNLSVQQAVHWLVDHFPKLTQVEMGMVLQVSQQLVSKFVNIRYEQRRAAIVLRQMDLDERSALRSVCHVPALD